jgi:hypothetical protein
MRFVKDPERAVPLITRVVAQGSVDALVMVALVSAVLLGMGWTLWSR